ncbi:universal stress protein [Elizabethkingia sp. JS20170427COW]|uniref:universal stress protein n=1 Tax=Elizabethkingia sp. JS20170427COW TaxID=2583851 RepID=UPI0011103904|nr:universal stress protein [Elizabethkingia sp. JS20170427COW]QCX52839.1 universal stress protein [Elizabethkingia sp. JS20170427COW]
MKTIILPVDFTEKSEFLIQEATKFAKETQSRLSLIHVAPLDIGFAIGDMGYQYFPEVEQSHIKEELLKLQEFQDQVKNQGIECDHILKQGEPGDIILDYAKEKEANYIVIGSHGRSGMYDMFIGSLTKAITRRSKIPVLVIPVH